MSQEYPKTFEILVSPEYRDTWWVSVSGQTLSDPQSLEQATGHMPHRSRAKVLVLHTSLQDEWVPVREAESLVLNYSITPERTKEIDKELAGFIRDMKEEIQNAFDRSLLILLPSTEQLESVKLEAKKLIIREDYLEPIEILKKVCPTCFQPAALKYDEDTVDSALGYLEEIEDSALSHNTFLNDDLVISEVIDTPTLEQLCAVLKSNSSIGNAENEAANRKLTKALARKFPELVKQTPEAQAFLAPKGDKRAAEKRPNLTSQMQARSSSVRNQQTGGGRKSKGAKGGCGLVLLVAVFIGWKSCGGDFEKYTPASDPANAAQSEKLPKAATKEASPTHRSSKDEPSIETKAGDITEPEVQEPSDSGSIFLRSLENIPLPVDLTVYSPFSLLDAAGKETTIPLDAVITISKRTSLGTLTIEFGGKVFIGNERRLSGKVGLAE